MEKMDGKTMDIVAENVGKLKELFPEAFTEGKVDFEALKEVLGTFVDDRDERYSFTWNGKSKARMIAQTPSTGTLRPCKEESVDWDTTQNIFIEGDNLEVLKLLQKSYHKKVKMIYIDPPYNTGKDFVYKDNFKDNIKNYKEITGQVDGEGRNISNNPETSGRYHTDWLNMMYPRLKLARNLLKDDGVIFISIHDTEQSNLRKVADEVFGEENFIAQVVWKARVKPVNIGDAKYRPQKEIEYVLVYQRSEEQGIFSPLYTGGERSYPHEVDGRKYRLTTILKSNRGTNHRSTMVFSLGDYTPPEGQRWQAGEDVINQLFNDGYIEFRDGTPFKRYFEDEEGAEHDPFYCFMEVDWTSTSEAGKSELNDLIGNNHGFDTVKPTRLVNTLITAATNPDDENIILDFFAGTATSAHSCFLANVNDTGNRKFILVQLPELCDEGSETAKAGYKTIAEISKERIRRSAAKIKEENPEYDGDIGLKVFKLDSTNIKPWEVDFDLTERTLEDFISNIKTDRREEDVLYEILLKYGLDLTLPITEHSIAAQKVFDIGMGALINLSCRCHLSRSGQRHCQAER
jgi:adenine-specific DNA-methyltransferase